MPAFQFRLQTLLDRRIEERQHAEEAANARERELMSEKQIMKELEQEAERAEELYQRKRAERVVASIREGSRLASQSDFLSGLKLDVQTARSAVLSQQIFVDQASEAVREAQAALALCRKEVDVLEKYREKAEKRFLQEVAYREELEQDEIGNVMHLSRRSRA